MRHRPALSVGRLHDGQLPRRRPTAHGRPDLHQQQLRRLHQRRPVRLRLRRRPPLQRPAPASPGNCRAAGDCTSDQPDLQHRHAVLRRLRRRRATCATEYDGAHICISGVCVAGNCHTRPRTAPQRPGLQPRRSHACDGVHAGDAPVRRRGELRPEPHLPEQRLHHRATATSPPTATTARRSATAITLRHVQHERRLHRRLRREPRLLGRRVRVGQLQQLVGRAAATSSASNHSCTACTGRRRSARPTRPTAPMHICLGTGSNAQCVAGNCHDTSGDVHERPDLRHHHARTSAAAARLGHRLQGRHATYGSTRHLPRRARCVHGRLPRHVDRVHRRQDLRRLDAAHLRHLRAARRRHAVHQRHPLRRGQHLLPGQLPGRQLPRHQRRLHRRQRGPHLRRDHAANVCGACTSDAPVHDRSVLRHATPSATRPRAPTRASA